MIEISDSLMALTSAGEISSPFLSLWSIKVLILFWYKAAYRWALKVVQVSLPLKLKNTSHWEGEEEEEEEAGWEAMAMDEVGRLVVSR